MAKGDFKYFFNKKKDELLNAGKEVADKVKTTTKDWIDTRKEQANCEHEYEYAEVSSEADFELFQNKFAARYIYRCKKCGHDFNVNALTLKKKIEEYDKLNDQAKELGLEYSTATSSLDLAVDGYLLNYNSYGVAAVIEEYKKRGIDLEEISDFYKI